jgi:ATP-dependent RNA helicase DDX19/DBP5
VPPQPAAAAVAPKASDAAAILQDGGTSDSGELEEEEEYEVQVHLRDLQADPNNPLYSAKTFEGLDL